MPELPEVQTIVNDLNKKILNRKIIGVWFDVPKIIKKPKAEDLEKQIKGLKITEIKRRGKNIIIYLNSKSNILNSYILLVHQKMTGHLLLGKWKVKREEGKENVESSVKGVLQEKVNNYIHVIFYLDNGSQLALSDLRKFAKIIFGPAGEIENSEDLKHIGPEPLEKSFAFADFKKIVTLKNKSIKEVLMDQNSIAGIGNIYSDEILWLAKIHPLRKIHSLSDKELKGIYEGIKTILKKAIRLRGTSISDYRDAFGKPGSYNKVRYVYRREGESCPRGNGIIVRIKVKNNRSAHFCPVCQKI